MSAVIGALRVDLGMNSAAFMRGVEEARRRLAKMQRSIGQFGDRMTRIGRAMSIGVTAPVVAFGALALKAGGDFEASMNRVGAITGATGDALAMLRNAAKDMGRETQYSASQAADALGFLGMAGFTAAQAASALPGTLQLAAAAQMDLAQSADIVSNVLSGYGMQVAELGRVNDVLVKTFTSSNTDLVQLGEAFKYVGPVANAAGISFEETAAAIGLMGNAGIQASMAGTSLRGAIGRILDPTPGVQKAMADLGLSFTDASGKILPLDEILTQLEPHANDAGLFMELFGQRAGPAMAALVGQGADALRGLRGELINAGGTASEIAAAQMEGFNGAMKRLRSAFEALQIAIAESGLLEFATNLADKLAGVLSRISEANPNLLRLATIVAGVAAVIGPLALVVGVVATGIAAIGPAVATAGAVLAGLAAAGGLVAVAWEPLTKIVGVLRENIWILIPVVGTLTRALAASLVPALATAASGLLSLGAAAGARLVGGLRLASAGLWSFKAALVSTGVGAIVVGIGLAVEGFMRLSKSVGGAGNAFIVLKAIATESVGRIGDVWRALKADAASAWEGIKAAAFRSLSGIFGQVAPTVNKIIGAFVGAGKAIGVAWSALPQALANVVATAANAVIDGIEKAINKSVDLLNRFIASLPAKAREFLGWSALQQVAIERVAVTATNAGQDIQSAFTEAFNRDYVGGLHDGIDGLADVAERSSEAFQEAGRAYMDAATAPLASVESLREAQRMLARAGRDGAGETADATEEAEAQARALEEALADAVNSADDLGGSGGARELKEDLDAAAEAAMRTKDALAGVGKSFVQDLVSNFDSAGANLWDGIKSVAGQALSNVIFNPGGVVAGVTGAFGQISAGLSGLAAGGGIAALGTAISGAMPIIGAAIAAVNLITNFQKTTQIGAGLKLGIEGGTVQGTAFDTFKRTSFWGLIKREFDTDKALPIALARSLGRQANAVKKSVIEVYSKLGVEVPEALLNRVRMTIRRIETEGLSGEEIEARIQKMFQQYAGALSRAVAEIGAQAAEALLGVQTVLEPIGKAFFLYSATAAGAGNIDLTKYGNAAKFLARRVGGVEALAQKTGAFFEDFFSSEEKLGYLRRQVSATFRELGRAVPATDQEFKRLVQSQDLLTQSGRRAFTALLEIAPVFDDMTDAMEAQKKVAKTVREILRSVGQRALYETPEELIDAFGGFDALSSKTSAFFETFYSEAEKLDFMRSEVAATFAEIGYSVPDSMEGFRALAQAQNLATVAGQEAYAALLNIAPVFAEVSAAAAEAGAEVEEVAEGIVDAAREMRGAYQFDATGYATAWEAKLAHELANAGAYSGDLIESQNAELAKHTELLEQIRSVLGRSANAAADAVFVGNLG